MDKSRKRSVHQIVEKSLCMGCGFCEPLCPEKFDAIRVRYDEKRGHYIPYVDDDKCTECGICLNMCPGEEIDYNKLMLTQFGELARDQKIGHYLKTCTGYAKDDGIRANGASGGMVTQLLAFALEKGLIDGAVVTRMDPEKCFEPQFIIARSREELLTTQKSQYLPMPLGVAMREVLKSDMRVAVVGLPCHIQGLRKSQALSRRLRERIVLTFGLLCFGTTRRTGVEYFLKTHQINPADLQSISFRSDTYPGRIRVKLKDGAEKTFNRGFEVKKWDIAEHLNLWTAFRAPFYMDRCFTCADGTSELADISFGDPWLPEFRNEKLGRTMMIIRSEKGKQLVDQAMAEGKVTIEDLSPEKVYQSQGNGECIDGTKDMRNKFAAMRLLGRPVPSYQAASLSPRLNPGRIFYYLFQTLIKKAAGHRPWWFTLKPLALVIYGCDFTKRTARKIIQKFSAKS